MAKNRALLQAAINQQDEFYTDIYDIEHELMYYSKELFYDKVVLCNCDDPYESAFFEYFATSFNSLRLKKLIATCYAGSSERKPYYAEITSLHDYSGEVQRELRILKGSGDFRSPECIELLKEADIVVTNPPHSLLREYIALLMKYEKKFLILGNINAVTYKEVFPLFMKNQIWMGVSIHSGDRKFYVPEYYPLEASGCGVDDDGRKFIRVKGVRWFTNMRHGRSNETMVLFRKYYDNPDKYPHYDNYDAIEVSKTVEIPCVYLGVMGVPITFLDKYNSAQFQILGMSGTSFSEGIPECHTDGTSRNAKINGKDIYRRIFVRRTGGIM